MKYLNSLLSDLSVENLSLEDVRYILNDDLICDLYNDGISHEIYVYNSVEELGKDQEDNATREKDDTDESFGEFLCTTECCWKLPSGKAIWIDEM